MVIGLCCEKPESSLFDTYLRKFPFFSLFSVKSRKFPMLARSLKCIPGARSPLFKRPWRERDIELRVKGAKLTLPPYTFIAFAVTDLIFTFYSQKETNTFICIRSKQSNVTEQYFVSQTWTSQSTVLADLTLIWNSKERYAGRKHLIATMKPPSFPPQTNRQVIRRVPAANAPGYTEACRLIVKP